MDQLKETTPETPAAHGAAAPVTPTPAPAAKLAAPTSQERLALIQAFQAQAVQRADLLGANLQVISGDLMVFAFRVRETLEATLAAVPTAAAKHDQVSKQADLYLRFIRQLDRLTQIERQMAKAPEPASRPS